MSLDDDAEKRVYGEFLDEVRDTVASLQVLLENTRSHSVKPADALLTLQHSALNLKTQASAASSPLIKLVSHRLSEYLAEIKEPSGANFDDIQVFIDKIQAVADGEVPDEADAQPLVRSLPAKRRTDVDFKIEIKNIEIMLVIPEKAMSRIVERELAACGYRVTNIHDPFQAFEAAVRTRPDMLLASMELPSLSGVELVSALAAMASTQGIPSAILTSYDWGHVKLRGLPPRVAIIRKGPKFGDDLAETLARFDIT